jgi:biopolymer transport protein ExbD
MRRRKRQPVFVPGLMISPMIDLIFQLLVFFIVSTMYMTDVQTIPIQLPVAKNATQVQKQHFAVTVKKDGSLFLNDRQIEERQLLQTAAQAKKTDPNLAVIIRSDGEANYKTVIGLLDALKGAGITRFGLATSPAAQP